MELIKRIKEAEKQAKDIVDQARTDAVAIAEETRRQTVVLDTRSQEDRRKAIEASVNSAQQQGQGQVETLVAEGQQQIQAATDAAAAKMDQCVDRVMNELKNL